MSALEQSPTTATTPESQPIALWSVREVREAMTVIHGGTQREDGSWYPDTARAASRYQVTRRTIERWIAGEQDAAARIPAKRLASLVGRRRPSSTQLRKEDVARRQWANRRVRRNLGRGAGNLAEYSTLGWLDPHLVAVVQEAHSPLCRVIVTRDAPDTKRRQTKGMVIRSRTTVRDKVDGESIRYEVLRLMQPWRMEVGPTRLSKGYTQTWLSSGPLLPLASVANLLRLDEDPAPPALFAIGEDPS